MLSFYKFFNQMLKSGVRMLSSEDIITELKTKKQNLERIVHVFEYITLEPSDIVVEWCFYKTALHACELLSSDISLFPSMYRQIMQYLAEHDVDLSVVCVSKSRLLTFLGKEVGELSSCCVDKSIGIVFHRNKADMQSLVSHALHASSGCATSQAYHTISLNHQVHELASHQKTQSSDQSMKVAFDVDQFVDTVKAIAPDLWEHVCELTQSVNERKGHSASVKEYSFAGHIKRLRRAYLVSLILLSL